MTLSINSIVNVNGSKHGFDGCKITKETAKAFYFETSDSFGSYLHEYNVSFWLPKSIAEKNAVNDGAYGININLPFWFDLNFNKQKI